MDHNRIAFIGAGYVGLVNGIGMVGPNKSNHVWIVESDLKKLNMLKGDKLPIYESGLDELLVKYRNNIHFTDNILEAIDNADYVFITVGTPMAPDGSSNLSAVFKVAHSIGETIVKLEKQEITVVMKSTVPVGTTRHVEQIITSYINDAKRKYLTENVDAILKQPEILKNPGVMNIKVNMVDNPEFLKEGTALKDFNNPDRIVIGTDTLDAYDKMKHLYTSIYGEAKFKELAYHCGIESAEMIKYASNSMLAMRISFTNMIAQYCEKTGANIVDVMGGVGLDKRIGPAFLNAGCGYGGSCFPKDVQSLIYQMSNKQCRCELLQETEHMNYWAREHVVNRIRERHPQVITLWGATFKPNSDDLRESPALYIMEEIDAKFQVYDPIGADNLRKWIKSKGYEHRIMVCDKLRDSINGSDMIVNHHFWATALPPMELSYTMNNKVFFDIKNQFIDKSETIEGYGFEYMCVGVK